MLSSIYLSGGTIDAQEVVNYAAADDWRSQALNKLQRYGLKVVNPLELAWARESLTQYDQTQNDDMKMRVLRSLELIDQCDAVLANLARSSYATAMEIFYAHRRGKMVTVVGQTPFSPWVLLHSKARFGDMDRALDYIIEEQPQSLPLQWALQHEGLLSERYEQFPPAGEPDYKFIGGDLPILVVAPHATAFWREGEFQEAEAFSGSMASLLSRMSGCYSLFTNFCCAADPCSYLETPFRRAFADVVKAGQVGFVLFLLGSSWHESPGLRLHAHDPEDDLVNRLRLKLIELEPVSTHGIDPLVGNLHRFTVEELGVPAITLKMHKRYRMPRLQPQPFDQLMSAVKDFLLEVGTEMARSNG